MNRTQRSHTIFEVISIFIFDFLRSLEILISREMIDFSPIDSQSFKLKKVTLGINANSEGLRPHCVQGISSGFDIMYLGLANRNMQVRFGLKVV